MAQAPRKPAASRNAAEPKAPGRSVAKRQTGTEVVDYEAELERQAALAAGMEKNATVGRSFSFKGGQMVYDGAPVKDNRVVVIVAGSLIEKAFYDGKYDPNNPEPPVCYAFSTDPDDLSPEANPGADKVLDLQSDVCASCPHNEWGSADTGRGKACKDVRRLALIPAGQFKKGDDIELVTDAKLLEAAEFGFAKLPPTSLNAFGKFVRQLSSTMKRPPHAVYAVMECVPDGTNQFTITWEALDLVDSKLLSVVMRRHEEAMEALQQPYTYPTAEERAARKPARGGRNAAPARKPAAGGRGKAPASGGRARKY